MSLGGVIAVFGESVTRKRRAAGSLSDGVFTPGAETSTTITASVQPVSGREVLRLPEGLRTREVVVAFSMSELRAADEVAGTQPDRLVWRGSTYEVQSVEHWPVVGGHYRAVAVRVEAP